MKPSRFHSARRNKRWQAGVGSIVAVVIGWWIYSANWNHGIILPIRGWMVVAGTTSWGFCGAFGKNGMGFDFHIGRASPLPNDYARGFFQHHFSVPNLEYDGISHVAFMIPYWVILPLLLGVLYLILPKSLPPPRKENSGE